MRGLSAVAGHRALSTGPLLIAAAGLALYQMTSLVLGPAGSRELHLSLSLPAADPDERSESRASGTSLSLGTLAPQSPAASPRAASTVAHAASAKPAGGPAATPVLPVAPQPPASHPSAPPLPPSVPVQDPKPAVHNDDTGPGVHHHDDDAKPGAHKGDDTD